MKLNTAKTQIIHFTSKGSTGNTASLLGVAVDESLRWEGHVFNLVNKLAKNIFVLRRLRTCLDDSALLVAYYGLVHCNLTYALEIWGNSRFAINAFILQKRAIRILARLGPLDSCRDSFVHLKILTLPCQYIFITLSNIHRRSDSMVKNSDRHNYDTRFADNLLLNRSRLTRSQRNKPDLTCYNILSPGTKALPMAKFRRALKSYLVSNAFYTIDEFKNAITTTPL